MSVSPDYTDYIDLTLYDKDPTDILESAQATLQARVPDWVPSASNMEVMLLEAMALEVGETIFSLNRLPESMLRVLLSLYGVTRDAGAPPVVDLEFLAFDTGGYTVPAGTEVALLMSNGEYLSFYTDDELIIPEGDLSGIVGATATTYTNLANGISISTFAELVDSITGIDAVQTDTVVANGRLPEDETAWTQRGVQRLRRLVDTLVIPQHFTQAALEESDVFRANTVDNYDGTDIYATPGDNPGNVTVVIYGDGGPLSSLRKAAIQDSLEQRANANLIIHVIDPTIVTVNVAATIAVKPTFTAADVIDAVETRLEEYLSPTAWPWAGTVRRNELISVIDQVAGVDYVGDITTPAADVVLGVGNSLASPGTITITEVV